MVCIIRNRKKFYKKTLIDVWGHQYLYYKPTKASNFIRYIRAQSKARYWYYKREFVYSFQRRIHFRRQRRVKDNYVDRRYLRNFYLVLTYRNFRRYVELSKKKQGGGFYANYLMFLECRIFMMAYRSNFITNIFMIRYLIDKGLFLVNGVVKNHYNFVLKPGDLFQVNLKYKNLISNDMIIRLDKNIILFKIPGYLFANYNFMFIFFWRYPKIEDVIFPVLFDVQLGSEFYYP